MAGLVDLVSGGPPCQPFSIAGKHRGADDERNMWPEAVRAVADTGALAYVFENVRGLLRPAFAPFVAKIARSLERPTKMGRSAREYALTIREVNAADYGAAQRRHRVFFLGAKLSLGKIPDLPPPTHSLDRLLWEQWITGEYWERHNMRRPKELPTNKRIQSKIAALKTSMIAPATKPWRTVRDAIAGLGEPDNGIANHRYQPGARVYAGHTGSPLDMPAKALKAGNHGVPGGENMMVQDDGSVRYFTVREAARLQGLPDAFEFPPKVPWSECMRQLGNAVPVELAEVIGQTIASVLDAAAIERAA
jgi:DNA (cytosine-5)-methyltransferase 1